jgi:hypothetical protein
MNKEVTITVADLKAQGCVECPRCREYHHNLMNPQAMTSKTKGQKHETQETVVSVSHICDKCCQQLLDAFADPDWKLFWPTVSDEEAETVVRRIKDARKAQLEHYRA